jgi:acyl-CoA synthetase (AMP-forming)/AMP-acid ligase II
MRGFSWILADRAQERPDATAFVFGDETITYGELHARAAGIAAGLPRDERVVLLYPPGLDYVAALFGCWYAGAVAVPAYPPLDDGGRARLDAILRDAEPAVVLSEPAPAGDGGPVSGGGIALLQYTSGSTQAPRGVVVTHANLLANSAWIERAFGHGPESRGVIWLPPYHDMGLIGGILQPVFAGFPCVLMSPLEFVRRPLSWLRAISDHRATTSGGPNFAYELCVRRIPETARASLDLSSWTVAFNGSERVRTDTLEAFSQTFEECGFARSALHPCYGLAESTLMATGGRRPAPVVRSGAVGCGQAAPGHRLVVVEPEDCVPVADGIVGEIWLSGPSVAAGYWRNDAATDAVFGAYTAGGDGPFLRTGDLGFLDAGELFVTGRIKELIVVAGRNVDPTDVELACERASSAVRPGCGAAIAIEHDGRESIGVVLEVRGDDDGVLAAVRRAVATATGVQAGAIALLERGTIPKTSSGKVQRLRCAAFLEPGAAGVRTLWRAQTRATSS